MAQAYKRSDSESVLKTVQELYEEDLFSRYLTPSQLLLLRYLLELPDKDDLKTLIWDAFLKGQLELLVELITENDEKDSSDGTPVPAAPDTSHEGGSERDDNDMIDLEQLKAQLDGLDFIGNLSLKVRYVVWEHDLTRLVSNEAYTIAAEFLELDAADDTKVEADASIKENVKVFNVPTASTKKPDTEVDNEEDNYDDEEEDDEDNYDDAEEDPERLKKTQTEDQQVNSASENSNQDSSSPRFDTLDNGVVRLHFPISKQTLNELPTVNPYNVIGNFHKIYHLFDNDKETLMRRQKLQENDEKLEKSRKRSHEHMNEEEEDDSENPVISHHNTSSDKENNSNPKSDIQMDLGVVNLSLRHLLKSVQQNKNKLDISDYELKHLLMDVRMNRSKWASDDKIGQEELYDACEKVVLELRNYTEHSTAFLNKVSKREAPNYYQVIKKPMDLNTVLKKLKTFQYRSKQEFVDDIMLIWRNCLTYNSDPKHFLRAHAIAMQKKSQQLIPLIPDITVRDRAQVEKELEEDTEADGNTKDEEEVAGSGRKGIQRRGVQKVIDDEEDEDTKDTKDTMKSSQEERTAKKGFDEGDRTTKSPITSGKEDRSDTNMDRVSSPQASEEEIVGQTPENSTSEPGKLHTEDMDDSKAKNEISTLQEEKSAATEKDKNYVEEEEEEEEEDDGVTGMMLLERDDDKDDLELSTWKTLTATVRTEICSKRSQLFNQNRINSESDAILKNPTKLKQFDQFFTEFKQQKEAEFARQKLQEESMIKNGFGAVLDSSANSSANNDQSDMQINSSGAESTLNKESNEITAEESSLLTEYNLTNCVPDLGYSGIGKERLDKYEEVMVQRIMQKGVEMKSSLLNNMNKGLAPKMNHNIHLIQQIRHICHKISLIRALQNPNKPKTSIPSQKFKEFTIDDSIDLDPISQLPSHDYRNDGTLINRVLHRNVSKIAMSNGFESTEPVALSMLSEIATDYLSNIIKTIKLHLETHSSNKRKPVDALNMTLLENGINKPDDLYSYMENEFGKKTRKLEDLKEKLGSFLKDLLRPTLQDISERNFDDESQSFLTGDFSSKVTGEDFFGFKELGLEKEFGELASNVPLQFLTFQFNGKDADVKVKTKVIQPEEFDDVVYKKLNKELVQIGNFNKLILPLLRSAAERSTAYYAKLARSKNADQVPNNYDSPLFPLLEDDEFPKVKGSTRPRLPPTGKISTNYKKKHVSELFVLPEADEQESVKVEVSDYEKNKTTNELFKSPEATQDNGFDLEETPLSSFSLSLPGMPDS